MARSELEKVSQPVYVLRRDAQARSTERTDERVWGEPRRTGEKPDWYRKLFHQAASR